MNVRDIPQCWMSNNNDDLALHSHLPQGLPNQPVSNCESWTALQCSWPHEPVFERPWQGKGFLKHLTSSLTLLMYQWRRGEGEGEGTSHGSRSARHEYLHSALMSKGLWGFRCFCTFETCLKVKDCEDSSRKFTWGLKLITLCREKLRVQYVQLFREKTEKQLDYRV